MAAAGRRTALTSRAPPGGRARQRRCRIGGRPLLYAAALSQPILAYAIALSDNPLYLSPVVDGVTKNGVVTVLPKMNGILIQAADLKAIGISPSAGQDPSGPDGLFIPDRGPLSASVDMQSQVIRFSVPSADLLSSVTVVATPSTVTPARSASGAFVNYALSLRPPLGAGANRTKLALAADLTGVLFGPYGDLTSNNLVQFPKPAGGLPAVFTRLNTTYELDRPQIPLAFRAGDIMTQPPGWGRSVFLGGVQLVTDYALQPSEITFPTPTIGQSLAQPSDLSLLVNNVMAYRGNADAGPFSLVGIPVINGLNEITVQTRSASGQIVSQTVPFYASATMLRRGLSEYNLSLGFIRHNYGEINNFYATPALDGSWSHGVTDNVTITLHGEAAPNLALLGAGFETSGDWGDLAAAVAVGEHQKSGQYLRQSGHLYSVQYSRTSGQLGVSAGFIKATSGYDDLGLETSQSYPVLSWHVSASASLPDNTGNVALGYTVESVARHNRDAFLLASYSTQITSRLSLDVSCFKSMLRAFGQSTPNEGCDAGFSLALGSFGNFGASLEAGSSQSPEIGETYGNFPSSSEGLGGSASNATGDYTSRNIRLQDVTQYADAAANVAQNGNSQSAEFDLSGSIIGLDGLFLSRPANNAFGVVDFGYPNVPVYLANQPVGKTNRSGRMLIPSLIPNYPNQISIDTAALPLSVSISDDKITVTPPSEGGVLVKFPIDKLDAALLHIRLSHGGAPPAGSLLYLTNTTTPVVIGYDGYAYLEDPPIHVRANIIMTSGHCHIDTDITISVHDALVGVPVTCAF